MTAPSTSLYSSTTVTWINFYVETQTRDERRMDVVVDYNGDRFVIEMKIWHGNSYNVDSSAKEISIGNKTIVEVVI